MSTAPAIDEREHAAVVIAAIKAALTVLHPEIGDNVYSLGDVPGEDTNPGTLPETFVAIQIERRPVDSNRLVSTDTRSGWRVIAQYVARTANNARLAKLAVINGLEGQRLVIAGVTSTPVKFELSRAIAPDSGMVSGSSQWTYGM